jgi:hypothetical protein
MLIGAAFVAMLLIALAGRAWMIWDRFDGGEGHD